METHYAEPMSKMMNLPILKHFDSGQLSTTSNNPLDSFRKGVNLLYSKHSQVLKNPLKGEL